MDIEVIELFVINGKQRRFENSTRSALFCFSKKGGNHEQNDYDEQLFTGTDVM